MWHDAERLDSERGLVSAIAFRYRRQFRMFAAHLSPGIQSIVMGAPRRYADYLTGVEDTDPSSDLKPVSGPRPTRAWVSRETDDGEGDDFHCLVEEFPGDHWNRTGGFVEMLRWALVDHEARDFYVWDEERRDWDRPSRDEVSRLVGNG